MNKRQKKKFLTKCEYKNFYKRAAKCKTFNDWFKLVCSNSMNKLIRKGNPFLSLISPKPENTWFEAQYIPVKLGESITFAKR